MDTYTIVNDRYSQQPDKVTLAELKELCKENGWNTKFIVRNGKIYDNKGDIVATLNNPE